jgi:hypothetical protein
MDIGLLWYREDKKRKWPEEIDSAAKYYQSKYGSVPTICYVNPADWETYDKRHTRIAGMSIRPNRTVITNHIWLGVETE